MTYVNLSNTLINERRQSSLTSIVYQELENQILSGFLEPGDRVNEVKIAEQLNVSRGIVREARRGLERVGLLTSIPNRGVFVKKVTREEYIENSEVRSLLTGFLCQKCAEKASDTEKHQLRSFVNTMNESIEEGDYKLYYKQNLEFHEYIVHVAAHKRADLMYSDLVKDSLLARKLTLSLKPAMQESNQEHDEIVSAIEANKADETYQAGKRHTERGLQRWLNGGAVDI